ncbi:MAG TPA: signal peptidase I [Streptosporangiaceae bacterium]|nr:signal peptidase I [Streptosporangiaceae bacterium]
MNDEQRSPDWLTEDLGAPGALAEPVAAATAPQEPPEPPEPSEPSGQPEEPAGPPPTEGSQNAAASQVPPRREHRRRLSGWQELPILIVVALAIALVIKSFVVQPFFIPSSSMEDTLLVGDKVLVNKLVYDFRGIDRGDIIVFNGTGSWNPPAPVSRPSSDPIVRAYDVTLRPLFSSIAGLFGTPADTGTDYVKRVIGLPGDHVACCNVQGLMTVNGVPLHESSYLYPGSDPSEIRFNITVPAGRLWVMGDNRTVSDDSRMRQGDPGFGTIPENEVIGRAFVIVWPPSRWRTLPIPSTFDQPALVKAAAAAAPYAPLAAGFGTAVPLTLLQRRVRRGVRRRRQPAGSRR